MNQIIIVSILLSTILMGIEAKQSIPQKTLPIKKPNIQVKQVEHNNYYTDVTPSCEKYIDMITQKDQEIEALKKELHEITTKENKKKQEKLQKEYAQKLKDFDNRSINKTTKSKAIISDRPID
ncbi:MAG: hypothetical protein U9O64_05440 [Campylobacterota bacterium]|nr:hypothetical protein [Campylobacterota bacterium]